MTRPHADLRPGDVRCVIDSREQTPLALLLPWERGTLKAGDYSVRGLENAVTVERKSLPDLVACCGRERDRFEDCVQRMKAYELRALVIEASWDDIHRGQWRSQMTPNQVNGALCSWMKHMSVILAGDRPTAAKVVSSILYSAARDRWRQLRAFKESLKIASASEAS